MAASKGQVVWHGRTDEWLYLLWCVDANCTCPPGRRGWAESSCGAHRMLVDQDALDQLAHARLVRDQYLAGEWDGGEVEAAARPEPAPARPARHAGGRVRTILAYALAAVLLFGIGAGTAWATAAPPGGHVAAWQAR
jgi:hypothetical protein